MRHFKLSGMLVLAWGLWLGLAPDALASASRERFRVEMHALYSEERNATQGLDAHGAALNALDACAASKDSSDRLQTCDRAQRAVDACVTARANWDDRKRSVLAGIRRIDPEVGRSRTPSKGGVVSRPPKAEELWSNYDEVWNDVVYYLARMELAACASTLPQTQLTPGQAIALWSKEGNPIIRCDSLSRDTADALDRHEVARAVGTLNELEATCAKLHSTYAGLVRVYRQRLGDAQKNDALARCDATGRSITDALNQREERRAARLIGEFEAGCSPLAPAYAAQARDYAQRLSDMSVEPETTALERKGGKSGALVGKAINQATEEEAGKPAREAARLKAEAEEERRAKEEEAAADAAAKAARAASDDSASEALTSIIGSIIKGTASRPGGSTSNVVQGQGRVYPECVPGAGYNARVCACLLRPTDAGCPGAPKAAPTHKWATPSPKR